MILEPWEIIILQLSYGCLLGGIVLFIFSLITAEFHFDHDTADVSDLSIETEVHIGGSFEADSGMHLDSSSHFDFGHTDIGHAEIGHSDLGHTEIGHSDIGHSEFGHTDHTIDHNPSTPILLILGTFFLMFGAIGVSIYGTAFSDPIVRLFLIIALPIGFVKLISILWKKYTSKEHGLEIPFVTIDNQVVALTHIDEKGGLVLADTGDYERPETLRSHEKMKMQAKTLPGITIERNSTAYVIAIDEKNTLIIDLWPKIASKKET